VSDDKPPFKLARVSVIMLGVTELARSVAFYRDTLGLSVTFEIPGFAFLDGGGVSLCLSQPLARASDRLAGATEIVFSVDDVTGAYDALRERGIRSSHEPRNVNGSDWAANFQDPDGHTLSVFGPPHLT